jgi:hypothetical protein
MARVKLSPSTIEAFRKGRLYERSDAELIDQITGEFKPNAPVSIGSAFGSLLEKGEAVGKWSEGVLQVYEPEFSALWDLDTQLVELALAHRAAYRGMAYEVRAQVELECMGYTVVCPMRVDGLRGLCVHEFKTTAGNAAYEDFERSVQWRLYLMAFPDAAKAVYSVFQVGRTKADPRLVTLKGFRQFAFERDTNLAQYVHEQVFEVLHFLSIRGLIQYIEV